MPPGGGAGNSMDTPAALAAASMLAAGGVAPGGYGKFVYFSFYWVVDFLVIFKLCLLIIYQLLTNPSTPLYPI